MPDVKNQIAQLLVGKGFQELFTNSITNSAFYPDEPNLVRMMNSLSAELDCMRPSMLETGLIAMAYNLNRKNTQLKFFEFGKTYHTKENGFIENEKLCLYCSGNYTSAYWNQKEQAIDLPYVKGIIESVFYAMKLEIAEQDGAWAILFQRKKIGVLELVSSKKQKQFDCKQEVWFVELSWDVIRNFYQKQKIGFKSLPKFPTVKRDLAIIIDKQVAYQEVQKTVKQTKSKLLQGMHLFDVFESEKLGSDKKSLAINLSFYDDEKTLTDIEVEQEMNLIIQNLESKLGAGIRKG
jgi:phenylalanyl-tRNA synthetase beta chain